MKNSPFAVFLAFFLLTVPATRSVAIELTLVQALELAAVQAPQAAQARVQSDLARGGLHTQKGLFDSNLALELNFENFRSELREAEVERQRGLRLLERTLNSEFTRISDDLDRQIAEATGRPVPDCQSLILVIGGQDVCLSAIDQANRGAFDELLRGLIDATDDSDARSRLEELERRQREAARQSAVNTVLILRTQAEAARQRLERMGAVPELEEQRSFRLDLGMNRLWRTGLLTAVGLRLDGIEDNFVGKPTKPGFGGKGIPRTYTSFLGINLSAPLIQGRGSRVASAELRAAELGLRASLANARHRARESQVEAAAAFWAVVAAQQRVQLLEASVARNRRILEIVAELEAVQEAPVGDLHLAEGRLATVETELAAAVRGLALARANLAAATGLAMDSLETTPVPVEALPPASGSAVTARWTELARRSLRISRRPDLLALGDLREASETLADRARDGLRWQVDLTLSAGYSGLAESFEDGLLDPSPYWDAVTGNLTGPSYGVAIRARPPLANRTAKGRLQRAEALAARSRIEHRNLARTIRLLLEEAASDLLRAESQALSRSRARASAEQVVTAYEDLFRHGERNLPQLILADEERTRAEIAEVAALELWAQSLARWRFEAGLAITGGVPPDEEWEAAGDTR